MHLLTKIDRPWRNPVVGAVVIALGLSLSACSDENKPEEKKEEASGSSPTIAAISPETAKSSGISLAVAGPVDLNATITLYGTVKPNAEKEQSLRARYPGTVRAVAKRIGDQVRRGENVISIESSESLQTYRINSPINGTVLERNANVGETVNGETVLVRIADLSTVWVEFAVFARDLDHVRTGLPVRISSNNGEMVAEGEVSYVAPSGDNGNQSVVARAVLDNARGRWIPGQFVTGEVTIDHSRAAVAVAPAALQAIEGKEVVFVHVPQGFVARPVKIGRRSREAIEITQGLSAGETYAAANSYLVKAELTKGEAEED
jgi:cobalt-zinc-cadmium efflux system membrane fusion protein